MVYECVMKGEKEIRGKKERKTVEKEKMMV